LLGQRLRLAQQLLETSEEPIERIAERAGFGTPANLRQHFGRATTVSPQAYRRAFSSGAPPPDPAGVARYAEGDAGAPRSRI
jgi:transcriptional regulator GlxA family with amidase domain